MGPALAFALVVAATSGSCRPDAPPPVPAGCERVTQHLGCCGPGSEGSFHDRFVAARDALDQLGTSRRACARVLLARPGDDPTLAIALGADHLGRDPDAASAWAVDADANVRANVTLAAVRTPAPERHLELYLRASRDPAPEARVAALAALRDLRDRPVAVAARVRELLSDPVPRVRAAAAAAAGVVLTEADGPAIAALLDDPDEDVKVRAAYALRALRR